MNKPGLITVMLAMGFAAGCGQSSPIREYVVDRDNERVVTSDALRDEFPSPPFRWSKPKDWRVADNDQFSLVAWSAGPMSSEARITVSKLPIAAGLEAQVVRWRGQIGMPTVSDPQEAKKDVTQLKLDKATGSWIELRGDAETILGLIVAHDDQLWVFKYRSSNETAKALRASFRTYCESIRIRDGEGT